MANTIQDQTATVGTALSYAFPANTFADTDAGDTLTYTATKSDDTALPSWLSFAAATRMFSGPTAADVGTVSVKVTASRQWRLGQRHLRHRGLGGGGRHGIEVGADGDGGGHDREHTRWFSIPGRR